MGFVENVNKTAGDLTVSLLANINTIAINTTNVNTVATNISSVNTAATSIGSINTNAVNIGAIQSASSNAAIVTNLYDMFDDRYLGTKSIAPTLDNDGAALLVGALYFDSVANKMRVYGSDLQWSDALTLTTGSISTITNKVIDDISNSVGADHVHYKVRNSTAAIIPVNTVVTASGTQPGTDYINVLPLIDPQTQIAIGVVHTALAVNGTGLVTNTGVVDNIDTSTWVVGTIIYPTTTGSFTAVKPTTGRYQACAIVLRQHSTQGTLLCEFTEPSPIASTLQSGYVQLDNTLTSVSIAQALTAAQGKVLQDSKQPLDATLTALAGITTVADNYVYATASDTFVTGTITTYGRSLVDDVDAATARSTLGVSATNTPSIAVGGVAATNVQAAIQELDAEKLNTIAYTAADVLAKLLTVDGTASGLDADLLDGMQPADLGVNTIVQRNVSGNALALGVATGTSFNSITALASTVSPIDGVATVGVSTTVARQDHIHGTDTSRAADTAVVHLAGAETVTGIKTFSAQPVGITKLSVGLGAVDNTTDLLKPVSTATQTALALKADIALSIARDSATGAAYIPSGTTAQRPVTPAVGYMRFNTTLLTTEIWNGTLWTPAGAGATGGGSDTVFVETSYNVTQNYTVTTGKSAITIGNALGNVTVADGVTITIPDSSIWLIQGI